MTAWFENGELLDCLPLDDRAAQYGDGLFETIAIREGSPRLLPLHLDRLRCGCERLGLQPPATGEISAQLETALATAVVDTGFAIARLVVSAGRGPRGYRRPVDARPGLRIGLFTAAPLERASYRDGVTVRVCATRLAIQPQLAGLKTLSRLEQVLAQAEWQASGPFEGLMHDTDDRLICGTMSNVFIVTGKQLATPAITRCGVSGVMRRHLLTLLDQAGIPCTVADLDRSQLGAASEVFLTNSQFGVLPVRQVDSRSIEVGPVTRDLMARAAAAGIRECAP